MYLCCGGPLHGYSLDSDISGTVSTFVSSTVSLGLEKVTNRTSKSWSEIGTEVIFDVAISYVSGKCINVPKITSGRNSFSSVYKSGLTKLKNKTANKMSLKVVSKGIGSKALGSVISSIWNGIKSIGYSKGGKSK